MKKHIDIYNRLHGRHNQEKETMTEQNTDLSTEQIREFERELHKMLGDFFADRDIPYGVAAALLAGALGRVIHVGSDAADIPRSLEAAFTGVTAYANGANTINLPPGPRH